MQWNINPQRQLLIFNKFRVTYKELIANMQLRNWIALSAHTITPTQSLSPHSVCVREKWRAWVRVCVRACVRACKRHHISLQGWGVRWRGIVNIVWEEKSTLPLEDLPSWTKLLEREKHTTVLQNIYYINWWCDKTVPVAWKLFTITAKLTPA